MCGNRLVYTRIKTSPVCLRLNECLHVIFSDLTSRNSHAAGPYAMGMSKPVMLDSVSNSARGVLRTSTRPTLNQPSLRVCTNIHTACKPRSEFGSSACSQRPSCSPFDDAELAKLAEFIDDGLLSKWIVAGLQDKFKLIMDSTPEEDVQLQKQKLIGLRNKASMEGDRRGRRAGASPSCLTWHLTVCS